MLDTSQKWDIRLLIRVVRTLYSAVVAFPAFRYPGYSTYTG